MTVTDPASLDRLHDIVVPSPVPWWPPAPGWYLLMALVVVLLVLLIARQVVRWHANAYRRAALAELNALAGKDIEAAKAKYQLQEAAEILKRTALVAAPRGQVAGLSGQPWIEWLNEHGGGSMFEGDVARLLEHGVYQTDNAGISRDELREAMETIRGWIIRHRVESPDSEGN